MLLSPKLYKLKVHFTYFYFGQVEIFLQVSDDLFDITLRRQVAEKGNFDPCWNWFVVAVDWTINFLPQYNINLLKIGKLPKLNLKLWINHKYYFSEIFKSCFEDDRFFFYILKLMYHVIHKVKTSLSLNVHILVIF